MNFIVFMEEGKGLMLIYFFKLKGFDKLRRELFKFFMIDRLMHQYLQFLLMEFQYENYYNQMNQMYYNVYNWPQPYHYQHWFQQLSEEQQAATLHPSQYTQVYSYSIQNQSVRMAQVNQKPPKLSRNQKRKIKKKELEEELEKETKAIGKWVNLQRKDLIQDLQKIEKQEQKIRKKKEQKLGHLIQINKEVAKFYRKKQGDRKQINRRVNTKKNKKRISFIKQLKQAFDKNKNKILGLKNKDDQWESDKEEEKQEDKKEDKQKEKEQQTVKDTTVKTKIEQIEEDKQIKKSKKQIVEIQYKNVGKLTGVKHNNMILRQWVRNSPSQPLNEAVLNIVNRLAYKQAIRQAQKPEKAKKLIVSGIKQCKRTLTTIIDKKRSRMLIVALNIERNPYKGGVDDQVQTVIKLAQQIKIPVIHACPRSHLGRAFTGKWGPRVTMISIINFEGYQDMRDEVIKQWQHSVEQYDSLT